MRIGRSYKRDGIEGDFDAIVIGSGIGGLTAAALLARHAHKRVLVLERHYTAGGFTHTFHRPGYDWDVGVHYIGETRPGSRVRQAFDAIGDGTLQWADMGDVYDTIVIGEDRYEFLAGRENWRRRMHEYFPAATDVIDRYLDLLDRTAASGGSYFAEKALPRPLSALVGRPMRRGMLKMGSRTTLEVLRELTDDRRLIAVLTGQHGDYGLPPSRSSFFMHALVARHYLEGGAYPAGGAASIARSILPVIEEAGGRVVISAEVERILVEKNRAVGVRLADGVEQRAPLVISDAGVANTFGRLLPSEVASHHGLDRLLEEVEPSLAHASLYLGFAETAAELGLSKSNVWLYPDDDHDGNFARISRDPEAPLHFVYISFPSAKDPDFENRHPGHATVEVITAAPYEWFAPWEDSRWHKRGEEYEALKRSLTDRMLAALFRECPQLEGKVDHCELSTPLSTAHFTGWGHGEIYGLAHTPRRFEQSWLRPRTPVKGLYLTGADICSAGVPGALFGGVLTASAVLGKNMMGALGGAPTPSPASAAAPA